MKLSFCDKLTSVRHLDEQGRETYSTHKGKDGEIICRRPGKPDQRILIYANEDGKMSICNLTTRENRETFRYAQNTCAEEWHKDVELISGK